MHNTTQARYWRKMTQYVCYEVFYVVTYRQPGHPQRTRSSPYTCDRYKGHPGKHKDQEAGVEEGDDLSGEEN